MSKYQTKAKTQKVYNKNRATENIIPANCVAVFPMLIVSGSTYITENGTMPQNLVYDKGSFLFWQEVFDGRSSIKIQWEDAIELNKPEGKNYYLADTKVGKYYFGKPISSGSENLEIGDDQSFEEFITMRANQQVKLRFEFQKSNRIMFDNLKEDLRFVDNDLYKLYLIPEICEGKLMYISDYEEIYEDKSGLSYCCEITFQALGNELQKSGKAVEQYPQWSAPGEFYVKPKIEYSVGEVREKRVIIDPVGLNPKPIKYLQVELQGPALTSCVYALGRRQEKDEETGKWKIGPSHHLLGLNFVSTQPNPLNRTSTPTKNYDCFYDEEVCFATNAEFLQLLTDKISQPLEQMKNGGLISLGKNTSWKGENPAGGIHSSNDPEDNNGSRFDYYDIAWRPLSYVSESFNRNTNGCIYAEEEISYNPTNDTMIDIMNKNVFQFNQQPIIPLSMYATRPFYLRNIPIIGSIANFFNLGDIHLWNNTTNRKTSHLIYFGDADLCALCANLQQGLITEEGGWHPFGQDGMVAFPINFFGNNESSYNKLGVNSVNTTFCIELTDLISLTSHNTTKTYNTILLGQSTDEEGTPIFPTAPDDTLLVNGSLKAQPALNVGYIIDAVIVQTIFDGKIRLSCYNMDDNTMLSPAWTTTILSNANWQGGAMRDWTNMYILSNWTDRFCRQQDNFTWPLPPHKPSQEEVIFNFNKSSTFDLRYSTSGGYAIFPEDWTDTLGNYKNVEYTNHTQRTNDFFGTFEIQYTALGIQGVSDRESFKNYFGNIQINCQGTQIVYKAEGASTQQGVWNELYKDIGSFSTDPQINTYNFELPIISFNNEVSGSWLNKELYEGSANDWGFLISYADLNCQGRMGSVVLLDLSITLENDKIVITAIDKSIATGKYEGEKKERYQRAGYAREYFGLHTMTGILSRWGEISYNLLLNQLKFVKRGNGTPISNSIYGVKRTETPLKSTKKEK